MRPIGQVIHVLDHPEEVRLVDHHGREPAIAPIGADQRLQRTHRGVPALAVEGGLDELDPLGLDDRAQRPPIGRMQGARHQHPAGLGLAVGTHRHQHRLRQGRGPVVERGVGDVQRGQRRHHRLEFVEQLQGALARLCLVGGVGAVELPAGGDLPHRRRDVVVIGPGADEAQGLAVRAGAGVHQPGDVHLRLPGRDGGEFADSQPRRDLVEQVVDGRRRRWRRASRRCPRRCVVRRACRDQASAWTAACVTGGIQQAADGARIGEAQGEDPAVLIGALVDRLRRIGKCHVDVHHLTGQGGVDVGRRLHGLDHGKRLAGIHLPPDLGGLDIDDVAQGLLGMVGDADGGGAVAMDLHPLVGLGVTQVGRGCAHGVLPVWAGAAGQSLFGVSWRGLVRAAPVVAAS